MDYRIIGIWKNHISKIIHKKLKDKYSNIILLDGDALRNRLKIKPLGSFSNKYRLKVGLKYVSLCKRYVNNRDKFVIIATMALISKVQIEYKKIKNSFDVFLDVPVNELKRRDPKGLYKKFKNKEINNMVGLDIKFNRPKNPSLDIKWDLQHHKKILKLVESDLLPILSYDHFIKERRNGISI